MKMYRKAQLQNELNKIIIGSMLFNSIKPNKISILILDFNLNNFLKINYILNNYISIIIGI